jgi:hypothetical protein
VTYFGLPPAIPRPLRWQRSVGSSAVTNGGRQRGTKLYDGSRMQRQEKSAVAFLRAGGWDKIMGRPCQNDRCNDHATRGRPDERCAAPTC